uniref:KRAB domain-containing protein n=1 Tax=Podarcis muralis TaxID=64176 RepID=A0A670K0K9_PODMU
MHPLQLALGALGAPPPRRQEQLCFEDVAVHFTDEEWVLLDPDQRALHKEVMEENREVMDSLSKTPSCFIISVLILKNQAEGLLGSGTCPVERPPTSCQREKQVPDF